MTDVSVEPDVLDDDSRGIVADNWKCQSQIDELIGVTESFRETVRLIAYRVLANPALRLNFYIFAQLSELGTGFSSSFERGSTQSDRRDDVMLWFSTLGGGVGFRLQLRGRELVLKDQMQGRIEIRRTIPLHDYRDAETRIAISAAVDEMFAAWWTS